jgi:tRNA(fMet)-specific endonuclease VapC
MYVLDTDYLSLIARAESGLGVLIRRRMDEVGVAEFSTTIANYDEQTRGWLAFIAKSKTVAQLIEAYRRLQRHLSLYCSIQILDFNELAATKYQTLKTSKLRIGTMDLRIAAIALAHEATLLSRNLRDFQRVPGLKVEDWTTEIVESEPR